LAKLPCDDQHFGYNTKLEEMKRKKEKDSGDLEKELIV
jgi:hypothetical protein